MDQVSAAFRADAEALTTSLRLLVHGGLHAPNLHLDPPPTGAADVEVVSEATSAVSSTTHTDPVSIVHNLTPDHSVPSALLDLTAMSWHPLAAEIPSPPLPTRELLKNQSSNGRPSSQGGRRISRRGSSHGNSGSNNGRLSSTDTRHELVGYTSLPSLPSRHRHVAIYVPRNKAASAALGIARQSLGVSNAEGVALFGKKNVRLVLPPPEGSSVPSTPGGRPASDHGTAAEGKRDPSLETHVASSSLCTLPVVLPFDASASSTTGGEDHRGGSSSSSSMLWGSTAVPLSALVYQISAMHPGAEPATTMRGWGATRSEGASPLPTPHLDALVAVLARLDFGGNLRTTTTATTNNNSDNSTQQYRQEAQRTSISGTTTNNHHGSTSGATSTSGYAAGPTWVSGEAVEHALRAVLGLRHPPLPGFGPGWARATLPPGTPTPSTPGRGTGRPSNSPSTTTTTTTLPTLDVKTAWATLAAAATELGWPIQPLSEGRVRIQPSDRVPLERVVDVFRHPRVATAARLAVEAEQEQEHRRREQVDHAPGHGHGTGKRKVATGAASSSSTTTTTTTTTTSFLTSWPEPSPDALTVQVGGLFKGRQVTLPPSASSLMLVFDVELDPDVTYEDAVAKRDRRRYSEVFSASQMGQQMVQVTWDPVRDKNLMICLANQLRDDRQKTSTWLLRVYLCATTPTGATPGTGLAGTLPTPGNVIASVDIRCPGGRDLFAWPMMFTMPGLEDDVEPLVEGVVSIFQSLPTRLSARHVNYAESYRQGPEEDQRRTTFDQDQDEDLVVLAGGHGGSTAGPPAGAPPGFRFPTTSLPTAILDVSSEAWTTLKDVVEAGRTLTTDLDHELAEDFASNDAVAARRVGHTAVTLGGAVYFLGGADPYTGVPVEDLPVLLTSSLSWMDAAPASGAIARIDHASCALPGATLFGDRALILVHGGLAPTVHEDKDQHNDHDTRRMTFSDLLVVDVTDVHRLVQEMETGLSSDHDPYRDQGVVRVFAATESDSNPRPSARSGHAMAHVLPITTSSSRTPFTSSTPRGQVYLYGGIDGTGLVRGEMWQLSFTQIDARSGGAVGVAWQEIKGLGAVPPPRFGHAMEAVGETLVVVGGWSSPSPTPGANHSSISSTKVTLQRQEPRPFEVALFNTRTHAWVRLDLSPPSVQGPAGTSLGSLGTVSGSGMNPIHDRFTPRLAAGVTLIAPPRAAAHRATLHGPLLVPDASRAAVSPHARACQVTAGSGLELYIQARDAAGRPVEIREGVAATLSLGSPFVAHLRRDEEVGGGGGGSKGTGKGPVVASGQISHLGLGVYRVRLPCAIAGRFSLQILGAEHTPDEPTSTNLDATSPSTSRAPTRSQAPQKGGRSPYRGGGTPTPPAIQATPTKVMHTHTLIRSPTPTPTPTPTSYILYPMSYPEYVMGAYCIRSRVGDRRSRSIRPQPSPPHRGPRPACTLRRDGPFDLPRTRRLR